MNDNITNHLMNHTYSVVPNNCTCTIIQFLNFKKNISLHALRKKHFHAILPKISTNFIQNSNPVLLFIFGIILPCTVIRNCTIIQNHRANDSKKAGSILLFNLSNICLSSFLTTSNWKIFGTVSWQNLLMELKRKLN